MFIGQHVLIIDDNIIGVIVGFSGKYDYLVEFTFNGAVQTGLFYPSELRPARLVASFHRKPKATSE